MAIIVEDCVSGNPNANSYTTVENLRGYADLRGVDLTGMTDAECEVLLIKAMDYIEAKGDRFQGKKKNPEQPLQWPRLGVVVESMPVGSVSIPRELEYAQFALAVIAKDHDLQPNVLPNQRGAVVREKIEGAIEVEYDRQGRASYVPAFAKPESLLKPLYKHGGLALVRS